MSFADKQTLEDLNLTGRHRAGSLFALFNQVSTRGGELILEEFFANPLTDPSSINYRSSIFQYLQSKNLVFPFDREQFRVVEDYLGIGPTGSVVANFISTFRGWIMQRIVNDKTYSALQDSVIIFKSFIATCREFVNQFADDNNNPLKEQITLIKKILDDKRLATIHAGGTNISLQRVAYFHHLFTSVLHQEMSSLCKTLQFFDVYLSVSRVAREKGFFYAHALAEEACIFQAEDLKHPVVKKAIGNKISLDQHRNVLFLTGANMAGKSTLMKSFGIAMYLGHMGFPVAAKNMIFSIKKGIYSSINIPDNLSLGYSHFFAEVHRVKMIAEQVSAANSLVVIFDELFKGTNVKDAYDATLAVTAAFAKYSNCFFIFSTHIIEVGEYLRKEKENMHFSYMPTIMEGSMLKYPYQMKDGITGDRHGMMIIKQERIIDIIRGIDNTED